MEIRSVYYYDTQELRANIGLVVAGCISGVSVIGLLLAMGISHLRALRLKGPREMPLFITTPIGIYLLCLLSCDLAHSTATLLSIKWILESAISSGSMCTTQAILYQVGNVGAALWSFCIAVHTFVLLFLRLQVPNVACVITVPALWLLVLILVLLGPLALQNKLKGDFYGITGLWCWIMEEYMEARLGLEYGWMFFSAFTSLSLYFLVFLRLRGNIKGVGKNLRLRWVRSSHAWNEREVVDSYVTSVARQMLCFPLAYTFLILPIAICRWAKFNGYSIPYWADLISSITFALCGFVNVVLYTTTRQVIAKKPTLPSHTRSSRGLDTLQPAYTTNTISSFGPCSPTKFEFNPPPPSTSHTYPPTCAAPPIPSVPTPVRISLSTLDSESFCGDCDGCSRRMDQKRNRTSAPVVMTLTPPTPQPGRSNFDKPWAGDDAPIGTPR